MTPKLPRIALVLSLALASTVAADEPASRPADDPSAVLHGLFEEQWEHWMRQSPTWASQLGDRRYNRLWPDRKAAAVEAGAAQDRALLGRLKEIDRAALVPADRLNFDLFRRRLENDLEEHGFRTYLMPLNHRGGVQTQHETAETLRFETVADYRDWIARMRAVDELLEQTVALLEEGMKTGRTLPRVIMQRVPAQIAQQVVDEPTASPFYKPFRELHSSLDEELVATLRAEAEAAISEDVLPGYRRFQRFFDERYLPATRTSVGASALPDGDAFYGFRIRRYTTTELSAKEIHEIGLAEVARIRGQMQRIIAEVGFEGDFAAFLDHLRTDPKFYHGSPEALLRAYRAVSKRADPELVKLFGRLPRMPYGVRPIPAETAPDTTTAYYTGPAADGSRAGIYWVNLYRPEVRPIYEIEALSLHEAVPGHHLQIALAQELGELPRFRRFTGYTAFVEGWGLYAESLGEEMGFYQDPYSKFGQLTYEMWRAVRLVVDTGLHALGWSRERAIEFFAANAAKKRHDIVNEIDRYIAWPGQALAYKIGELRIKELRQRATEQLGEGFDVRGFHDVVLGSGAVPLDVLERHVDEWIATRRSAASGG